MFSQKFLELSAAEFLTILGKQAKKICIVSHSALFYVEQAYLAQRSECMRTAVRNACVNTFTWFHAPSRDMGACIAHAWCSMACMTV